MLLTKVSHALACVRVTFIHVRDTGAVLLEKGTGDNAHLPLLKVRVSVLTLPPPPPPPFVSPSVLVATPPPPLSRDIMCRMCTPRSGARQRRLTFQLLMEKLLLGLQRTGV